MPAALLFLLYTALIALPFVVAHMTGHHPRPLRDELATGLGIAALVILQVEFVLSGRFRAISARVGMDVTMRIHQLLARSVLALALLHPVLYGASRDSFGRGFGRRQGWLDYSWDGIWPGYVALLGLGALVAMALGRDTLGLKYHHWRLSHGIGAVAVAGFGTLHALRAGRYSADPAMAAVWQGLFAVAVASLLWVYVVKPLMKAARPWEVRACRPIATRTWELVLSPKGHAGLNYEAGQFAWISVGKSAATHDENPFSIASAPAQGPDLRFVIKELGDFTGALGDVQPGTRAYVDAPFGALRLSGHDDAAGVALIAGGVGIAPMLSLLREMAATGDARPRTLIYANRAPDQIACADELDAMVRDNNLHLVHVLSEPPVGWEGETGFVTPDLLARVFDRPDHAQWLYVLCGPPPMIEAVEAALLHRGVPHRNILLEQFVYD